MQNEKQTSIKDKILSIKDGINELKDELTAQEEMLKNVVHLERFTKKYKTPLIVVGVVAVLAFFGLSAMSQIEQNKITKTNVVLYKLKSDPKNSILLTQLKENNPKLHSLYMMSQHMKQGNYNKASKLAASQDEIITDFITYQASSHHKDKISSYDGTLNELASLQSAYLLLKKGDIAAAQAKLNMIPLTSPLKANADALAHYKK